MTRFHCLLALIVFVASSLLSSCFAEDVIAAGNTDKLALAQVSGVDHARLADASLATFTYTQPTQTSLQLRPSSTKQLLGMLVIFTLLGGRSFLTAKRISPSATADD